MIIKKRYILGMLFVANNFTGFSKQKINFRLLVTPKICNSNLTGISLGYHSFIGGNQFYDNKSSLAYTTDFMGIIQYNINNNTSINIGFGTANVIQKFKLVYEDFGVFYNPIYHKTRFQKIPLALEKRFNINQKSQLILNVGVDMIFDLLKPKINTNKGNLKLIKAGTKEEITYANYEYYTYNITTKTFNPLLSIGIGYKKKFNSKLSFVSIFEMKQGFSPQVNSYVYFNQYYSNPSKVTTAHIFSSNNGQSLNFNIGIDYKL